MKLYISIDMEGIWGITSKEQVHPEGKHYQQGRELMTEELNLVVETLLNLGVKEILVNDSHGPMDNVLIEKLHHSVSLITGNHKPLSMMEGIKEDFDGVLFIGYHPRASTNNGIFDHTYSGKTIESVTVNGKTLSEGGLNAYLAGYFNVPVIFASGDDVFTKQIIEEIGLLPTLAVKETISRYAAKHCSKENLKNLYKEHLDKAINSSHKSFKMSELVKAEIRFKENYMLLKPLLLDNVEKVDAKTVTFISNNYLSFYKTFQALLQLASL